MPEARDGREQATTYQVFLAPAASDLLATWRGRLAKFYGLDVHGRFLLSRRAAIEMGFAAVLLTVIFSFDLGAWYLLFNAVFHSTGDLMELSLSSLGALGAALLIASAVVIYERGFISADTSGNLWKVVGAFLLRAFIILVTAFITAQPVELLVFRGPIQRRLHEEGLRAELVARLTEMAEGEHKLQDTLRNIEQLDVLLKDTTEGVRAAAAVTELKDVQNQRAGVEKQLSIARSAVFNFEQRIAAQEDRADRARAQITDTEQEIRRLERTLATAAADDPRRPQISRDLNDQELAHSRAEEQRGDAIREVNSARSSLATQQGRVQALSADRGDWLTKESTAQTTRQDALQRETARRLELEKNLSRSEKTTRREIADLRRYVDRVRKFGLKRYVPWSATPDDGYRRPERDFFDQLRVLGDLRTAYPAKWPIADPAVQEKLSTEFGLDYDTPGAKRLLAEAGLYERTYWVTFSIAFVIPLLVLAVKLLMPRELSEYYSSEYQARHGNPEALLLIKARDETRARNRRVDSPTAVTAAE